MSDKISRKRKIRQSENNECISNSSESNISGTDSGSEGYASDDFIVKSGRKKSNEKRPKRKYTKRKGISDNKAIQPVCSGTQCSLCNHGFKINSISIGWKEVLLGVFYHFKPRHTVTEDGKTYQWLYFPDAFPFIEKHWSIFCPKNNVSTKNWRRVLQDSLSHSPLFVSRGKYHRGYWRLKSHVDLERYFVDTFSNQIKNENFNDDKPENCDYKFKAVETIFNEKTDTINPLFEIIAAIEYRQSVTCQ